MRQNQVTALLACRSLTEAAIVAGVPYGCANTVMKALQCMNPGIDQSP
jgi:hypothetical protein